MKIIRCEQNSPEWFAHRKGSIGGTRFGQVISGRKNRLIYELLNERLNEFLFPDDYIDDAMQFGIDNEPVARALYSKQSGIEFEEIGLIQSDYSPIHHHSPDGINIELGIVLEIKCTQDGSIHLERFFEGVDTKYMPQVLNAFTVSDEVKEVHWISYCPNRPENPIVVHKFTKDDIADKIATYRNQVASIEKSLIVLENQFTF